MRTGKTRVGLIGTGNWARTLHGPGLRRSEDIQFLGLWGRNKERTLRLARELETLAFPDLNALLESVDAVAVAVDPMAQPGVAIEAAQAGKHVLLEKPLALDNASAARIAAAIESAHVQSLVFLTQAFDPTSQQAMLRLLNGRWDGVQGRVLVPGADVDDRAAARSWREVVGALWDVGPHVIAAATAASGDVVEVLGGHGPHQTTFVTLRHASGAISQIAVSLHAPKRALSWEITAFGKSGTAKLGVPLDPQGAYQTALRELASGKSGVRTLGSLRSHVHIVRVLTAIETSLVSRSWTVV